MDFDLTELLLALMVEAHFWSLDHIVRHLK